MDAPMRHRQLLVTALVLLAGCMVGPDYRRPSLLLPARWRAAGRPAVAPTPVTDLGAWWHAFGDQTLDAIVDQALAENLDLKTVAARVREARAARVIAASGLYPSIGTSASYARTRPFSKHSQFGSLLPGNLAEANLFQGDFDASWELDVFGGIRRGIEAADADVAAAEDDERDVRVTLLAEVARNYVEIRSLERRIAIAAENIENQRSSVALTEDRFRTGLAHRARRPRIDQCERLPHFRQPVLHGWPDDKLAHLRGRPAPRQRCGAGRARRPGAARVREGGAHGAGGRRGQPRRVWQGAQSARRARLRCRGEPAVRGARPRPVRARPRDVPGRARRRARPVRVRGYAGARRRGAGARPARDLQGARRRLGTASRRGSRPMTPTPGTHEARPSAGVSAASLQNALLAGRAWSTHDKAFWINLDAARYGTFAEIGAGQEVARWFFRVGGAAGTVAKTISAYDMAVSDALYGPTDHYVGRTRLEAMLDRESARLVEQLGARRGGRTAFFVFADTVAARSYSRRENGHGWIGVRFQNAPHGESSEIVIHVHLLDQDPAREQEALGVLGVNLIFGAFYQHETPPELIASLLDGLTRDRLEVDMIKLCGPAFPGIDNRLMSLQLVEQGLTDASMLTADGEVVQPSEVLYQRPILVERGSFRPVTKLTLDLLESAREQFVHEPQLDGAEPVVLMEMTLRSLTDDRGVDHEDFLSRAEILQALGNHVLISNCAQYFQLVEILSRYTNKMIGLALGLPSLLAITDERY